MENTNHEKRKLTPHLISAGPFMLLVSVAGISFFVFSLYRFFNSPKFITESLLGLVAFIVSGLLIAKYIMLILKTQALKKLTLTDAEKLELYYSRTATYWILDGVISITGLLAALLFLLANYG